MSTSRVTIHMAASLDGYIARKDGSVDWLETSDEYPQGESMDPEYVATVLKSIDCYVMGSRTYETALGFEDGGHGWAYGDKPVFVLSSRTLPKRRESVEFVRSDVVSCLTEMRTRFQNIWVVGGGAVAGECLRRGVADELRYSILPVLIGEGVSFFDRLDRDIALHLAEVKAYKNGMLALNYHIRTR